MNILTQCGKAAELWSVH